MKKYKINGSRYISEDTFDKYEEAELAAKREAASNAVEVTIIERTLIATVKPDLHKLPVTVEMVRPE